MQVKRLPLAEGNRQPFGTAIWTSKRSTLKIVLWFLHNCRETEIRKKDHHHCKLIKKSIKRSKQFEVRKILRRLKEAQESRTTSHVKGSQDVSNLEEQLQVAKNADVDFLSSYIKSNVYDELDDRNVTSVDVATKNVVLRRILAAKCVQLEKVAMLETLKGLRERRWKICMKIQNPGNDSDLDNIESSEAAKDRAVDQPSDRQMIAAPHVVSMESEGTSSSSMEDNVEEDDEEANHRSIILPYTQLKDPTPKPQKKKKHKNRLGQRARRRLAEQHYGGNAAHLVRSHKLQKASKYKDEEGDPRSSRSASASLIPSAGNRKEGKTKPSLKENGHNVVLDRQHLNELGLHPSWAQRRQQAAEVQRKIMKPQGKKTIFSEDSD